MSIASRRSVPLALARNLFEDFNNQATPITAMSLRSEKKKSNRSVPLQEPRSPISPLARNLFEDFNLNSATPIRVRRSSEKKLNRLDLQKKPLTMGIWEWDDFFQHLRAIPQKSSSPITFLAKLGCLRVEEGNLQWTPRASAEQEERFNLPPETATRADDDDVYIEITLDIRDGSVEVHSVQDRAEGLGSGAAG